MRVCVLSRILNRQQRNSITRYRALLLLDNVDLPRELSRVSAIAEVLSSIYGKGENRWEGGRGVMLKTEEQCVSLCSLVNNDGKWQRENWSPFEIVRYIEPCVTS